MCHILMAISRKPINLMQCCCCFSVIALTHIKIYLSTHFCGLLPAPAFGPGNKPLHFHPLALSSLLFGYFPEVYANLITSLHDVRGASIVLAPAACPKCHQLLEGGSLTSVLWLLWGSGSAQQQTYFSSVGERSREKD